MVVCWRPNFIFLIWQAVGGPHTPCSARAASARPAASLSIPPTTLDFSKHTSTLAPPEFYFAAAAANTGGSTLPGGVQSRDFASAPELGIRTQEEGGGGRRREEEGGGGRRREEEKFFNYY